MNSWRCKKLYEATAYELIREFFRRLLSRVWGFGKCILRFYVWYFGETREKRVNGSVRPQDNEDDTECLLDVEELQKRSTEMELRSNLRVAEEEIEKYKDRLRDLSRELETLTVSKESAERRLRKALADMDDLKKAKDDALSRLSEMMGVKLRDNNPAITDLNDPNRPMKLGEQFNELYENDWTDAFVELQKLPSEGENGTQGMADEEIITVLLNILKEVNQLCCDESDFQLKGMLQVVKALPNDDAKEFIKAVKDLHKTVAPKYIPVVYKKVTEEDSPCKTVQEYISSCQPYIENCVKICYLAAVQDPPMYFHFKPEDTYDKQIFKEYTAMGSRVKFLVWPALFLHKGGALLSKGVVQPLPNVE